MYTTRKGDTLVTIADRFGVSLDQLRRWNKISGFKVEQGRRLHVGEAANVPHGLRGHHHAASVTVHDEGGAKPHESPSTKERAKKTSSSSSKNERGSSRLTQASGVKGEKHVESVKSATGAKKRESAKARKRSTAKIPKKGNTPVPKQK
jgi:membrane-bound lytic murein transglycosylase D